MKWRLFLCGNLWRKTWLHA